jgi:hypothetical protein
VTKGPSLGKSPVIAGQCARSGQLALLLRFDALRAAPSRDLLYLVQLLDLPPHHLLQVLTLALRATRPAKYNQSGHPGRKGQLTGRKALAAPAGSLNDGQPQDLISQ